MIVTQHRPTVDRRTLVAGAAWSVPAIMVATALPAFATSRTKTTASVVSAVSQNQQGQDRRLVVTLRLATDDGTALAIGTSGTFELVVSSTRRGSRDVLLQTSTSVPNTVSLTVNPAQSQSVSRDNPKTFTVTFEITGTQTVANLDVTVIFPQFNTDNDTSSPLSLSASATAAIPAPGNGTAVVGGSTVTFP